MKLLTLLTLTLLLSCTKTATKENKSKDAAPKPTKTKVPTKTGSTPTKAKPTPMELAHSKVQLAKAPLDKLLKALPQLGGEMWYGLYMMNSKMGYFSQSWAVKEVGGAKVVESRQLMHVEIKNMQGKKVVHTEIMNRFATSGKGHLLAQEVLQKTPMENSRFLLEYKAPGRYLFTTEKRLTRAPSGKRVEKKELTIDPGDLTNSELALSYLIAQKKGSMKGPRAWRIRKFLHTHGFVTQEVLTLKSAKKVAMAGVQSTLYKATVASAKPRSSIEASLDEKGQILQSKMGFFVVKRETKKVATNFKVKDDLGFMAMIPASLKGFTPDSKKLTLTLKGTYPKGIDYLNTDRYKVAFGKGEVTLALTKDNLKGLKLPSALPVKLAPYTKATVGIESEHPFIKKMALKAVGNTTDPVERVKKLNKFVHRALVKTMWADFDSAVNVAKERKGDCTEHSLLFTALARSLGIPARRVGGVGYVELKRDTFAFGYHMWVQVWLGRWIDVDPTWGQFPADASHILMGNDLDTQWVMSIGSLKLKSYKVEN